MITESRPLFPKACNLQKADIYILAAGLFGRGQKGLVCLLKACLFRANLQGWVWPHGLNLFQNLCLVTDLKSSSVASLRAGSHREDCQTNAWSLSIPDSIHILLPVTAQTWLEAQTIRSGAILQGVPSQ